MAKQPPPSLRDVVLSANKVAAVTGGTALCAGYVTGLFANHNTPVIRGVSGFCVYFPWGLSYWVSRHYTIQWLNRHSLDGIDRVSTPTKLAATFVAGSLSRLLVNTLWTLRVNLTQAVAVGFFSVAGQSAFDAARNSRAATSSPGQAGLVERVLSSKWLPMKRLSDHEYLETLQQQLIRIDAETALIEQELAHLRDSKPE